MSSVVKLDIRELFLVFVVFWLLNIIQGFNSLVFCLESVYTKYFTLSARDLKEAYDNFNALEKQLNALLYLLPQEYQVGFIDSIKKLNGTGRKKFLQEFYLEYEDDKLHIKTND